MSSSEAITDLRPPICSVVGHVDAGKTSFLDRLRGTRIVENEAGRITQKIGVTFFSCETLKSIVGDGVKKGLGIPGLMLIDTPGHECFTNQRMCGIEISDIVIVIVDIFKGLEKQTLEVLDLLKRSNTPFIIVANKLDRINGWASDGMTNVKTGMNRQKKWVKQSLDQYLSNLSTQLAENGYNGIAYYKNRNPKEFISIVPVSSKTGEGLPDLLMVVSVLTTKFLKKKITIGSTETKGFVVEKLRDKKHGEIVTLIVTDGELVKKSPIVLMNSKRDFIEAKVKNIFETVDSKEVKDKLNLRPVDSGTAGSSVLVKLDVHDQLMTGSRFYSYSNAKELEHFKKKIVREKTYEENDLSGREFDNPGIFINALTVGTMIALLNICDSNSIPVAGINYGSVSRMDVIKATLHRKLNGRFDDDIYNKRYGVILAYDTEQNNELNKDVVDIAKKEGVEVFCDKIIYNLIEKYQNYVDGLDEEIRKRHPSLQPECELFILSQYVFIKKDPILIGVQVRKNKLIVGMKLCTDFNGRKIVLGRIKSIEKDNKPMGEADTGDEVCIKIEPTDGKYEYGKDFDDNSILRTFYSEDEERVKRRYKDIFNL